MAKGDAVICNSQYTARIVRERHPEAADRVGVIYRGFDGAKFDPAAVSSERVRALREAWGVPEGKRIVLLPARLTRWKGQGVLVEAAALLRARRHDSDLAFVLVGEDQGRSTYRAELQTRIESLGLADRVILAGHCDDMPAAYKAASLTVLPSLESEAFGRTAVEAQAMGCLAIASRIGGFLETIAPEPTPLARVESAGLSAALEPQTVSQRNPWLFEPGNPEALCDSMSQALALSGEALEAVRARSIERVRASFSKRALQLQTLTVYDRLIGTQLAAVYKNATN